MPNNICTAVVVLYWLRKLGTSNIWVKSQGIGDVLPIMWRMLAKMAVLLGFMGILFAGWTRQGIVFGQFCQIYQNF